MRASVAPVPAKQGMAICIESVIAGFCVNNACDNDTYHNHKEIFTNKLLTHLFGLSKNLTVKFSSAGTFQCIPRADPRFANPIFLRNLYMTEMLPH